MTVSNGLSFLQALLPLRAVEPISRSISLSAISLLEQVPSCGNAQNASVLTVYQNTTVTFEASANLVANLTFGWTLSVAGTKVIVDTSEGSSYPCNQSGQVCSASRKVSRDLTTSDSHRNSVENSVRNRLGLPLFSLPTSCVKLFNCEVLGCSNRYTGYLPIT